MAVSSLPSLWRDLSLFCILVSRDFVLLGVSKVTFLNSFSVFSTRPLGPSVLRVPKPTPLSNGTTERALFFLKNAKPFFWRPVRLLLGTLAFLSVSAASWRLEISVF